MFKLALDSLSPARSARAFERFFGLAAPAALGGVINLTPGDFAVVRRQLRFRPAGGAAEIVALLDAEARAKPERASRIGF